MDILNLLVFPRNDDRCSSVKRIGDIEAASSPLFLATSLFDKEWDVRAISLQKLIDRRLVYGRFPYEDKLITQAMTLCLGDDHSIIRQSAKQWIEQQDVADNILLFVLEGIHSSLITDRLRALRAAISLTNLGKDYSHLLRVEDLCLMLQDEVEEARTLTIELLANLDSIESTRGIILALSDIHRSVRLEALSAVCELSHPVSKEEIIPLIDDPDEN